MDCYLLKVVPSGRERRMRSCAPFSCRASSRPSPLPLCALLPLCRCFSAFSDSSTCAIRVTGVMRMMWMLQHIDILQRLDNPALQIRQMIVADGMYPLSPPRTP